MNNDRRASYAGPQYNSHHDGGADEPLQQQVRGGQLCQQAAYHQQIRKVAWPVLLGVIEHRHRDAANDVERHDEEDLDEPPVRVLCVCVCVCVCV